MAIKIISKGKISIILYLPSDVLNAIAYLPIRMKMLTWSLLVDILEILKSILLKWTIATDKKLQYLLNVLGAIKRFM